MTVELVPGSFRDPSGSVFRSDGVLHRQVDPSYAVHYDRLMSSGLYEALVTGKLLVPHQEVDASLGPAPAHRVLRPLEIGFISHPYEWCFSQLREAALLTLRIQRIALDHGMTLKDASAYNVQFHEGRPVLIDTLSFEVLREGEPWIAYRQFCQHFLAPLALMAYRDVRMAELLRVYLDGIPLDLAAALLPRKAWRRPALFLHLRTQAKHQARHAGGDTGRRKGGFGLRAFRGLVASLEGAVRKLSWKPEGQWADYYEEAAHYTDDSLAHKEQLVAEIVAGVGPRTVWDLGGNTGRFARIATATGAATVCFDVDPACVERAWREVRAQEETSLLPLVCDLTNPSPSLGWEHRERPSLTERGPADLLLALALVHHLAIGNNVPLPRIAGWFAELGRHLVIEWVPKDDPKVGDLLASREDVFPGYTPEGFEAAFRERFAIERTEPLRGSGRILYSMRRLGT